MEAGQETSSAPAASSGPARRPGPVQHIKATWQRLSPDQKRQVLLEFKNAYDNDPESAFGSELQSDAALNWVVLRLRGRRSWRSCEDVLDELRGKLTQIFSAQEPFKSAVLRLGEKPETVDPKKVLKEIKRADKKAYDALMVRQNGAFSEFYRWVKSRSLKLAPYVVALLVLLRFGRTKRAVAATATLVSICLVVWCQSNRGTDNQLTSASAASPSAPQTRTPAAGSEGRVSADVALEASPTGQKPSGGSSLNQQPFFRLKSLSQNVAFKTHPGELPDILREGWTDYSNLTVVPAKHIDQWRRVQDLDRRAAEASREGRYDEALELYKQLIAAKNEASGWNALSGGIDIDDYVTVAIARRGRTPYLVQHPGYDGPAVLGLEQYEYGRMYEDLGDPHSALAEYGSCIWRRLVVPENVRAMQAENLAASNWAHFGDLRSVYEDAGARASRLATELSAKQQMLVSNGFALWLSPDGLIAVSLAPSVPPVCAAFDRGPDTSVHNFGESWFISTDYEGVSAEQPDESFAHSGIVIRKASPPPAAARKTLVVHWHLRTDDPERRACRDIATRIDFCLFPDSRIAGIRACP